MKVKVAGGEVELKNLRNGFIEPAVAEKLFSLGADGKTTNLFDKGTHKGVVTIGKNIFIAFLEDESGLVVPFYWDRGRKTNNARIGDKVSYTKKTDSVTVRTGMTGGVSAKVDDLSRDALTEMANFYAGLTDAQREQLVQLRMDASKFPFGELFKNGIELKHTDGKGNETLGALIGGPKDNASTTADSLYLISGMSYAEFKAKGLSREHFLALVARKDTDTATFKVDAGTKEIIIDDGKTEMRLPKSVSVRSVKDGWATRNKNDDSLIRFPQKGQYWLPKVFTRTWEAVDYKGNLSGFVSAVQGLTVPRNSMVKNTKGEGTGFVGWLKDRFANIGYKSGTSIRHGLLTLALLTSITVATLGFTFASQNAGNVALWGVRVEQAQTSEAESIQGKIASDNELARMKALNSLEREDSQAREAARKKLAENVGDRILVGKQYADGTFDMSALEDVARMPIGEYKQQSGRDYKVEYLLDSTRISDTTGLKPVSLDDGTVVYKDENDRFLVGTNTAQLTDEEVEDAGFGYDEIYAETYYEGFGAIVASDANEAGAPMVKYDQNGNMDIIVRGTEYVASGSAEDIANFTEGYIKYTESMVEEGLIGAQGVEDDGKYLQSEAVLAAAAKVAGENAGVLAMQQEGEHSYVYIQSEDGKSLHRIEVSGDAKALASEIEASKGGKNDQVFMRATEYVKSVYPNLDEEILAGIYDNTYLQLHKTTKNGVTTCTSTIADIGLDGSKTTIEVRDGHSCQASRANFRDSEAAVVAVDGADAAFNNLTKYTVDPPTSTAAAESGRDRA